MTDPAKTESDADVVQDAVEGETAGSPADVAPVDPDGRSVLDAEPVGADVPAAPEAADQAAPEDVPPPPDPLLEAREQAAEYLQLAQRKQAEFENFRKRMQTQSVASEQRGVAKVAKELLAPLDHLGLAIGHAEKSEAGAEWLTPLRALQDELGAALKRVGVESFDPQGEVFDPTVHEAMASQPVEGAEAGTVAITYQAGYKLGDTVLRPARVVVAA